MKKLILASALITSAAWANLHLAPPDFNTDIGKAIFVDFTKANYDITYDVDNKIATVVTKITFNADKAGTPIFDLVPVPTNIKVDGVETKQSVISFPGNVSTLRQLHANVEAGTHTLEMVNTMETNVSFAPVNKVSSAFWIRDLKERMFLEQYVPSNFEFDQYQMSLLIKIKGVSSPKMDFYTNGKLTQLTKNSWIIDFPEYYTVSSPYFHMTPKGAFKKIKFSIPSIAGNKIPVTVYSKFGSRNKNFKAEAIRVMNELEADYGPWAHSGLVAYGNKVGVGGMEHSGATATGFESLDHEMLHSYFAKGIYPANGNSGWIDEAIASWRDKGYQRNPITGFSGSNLGAASVYQRNTDNRAYGIGAAFLAYIDWRLQDVGGLKAFLRGYFAAYKHTVITITHFKNNLEFFSGLDLTEDFNTYILGHNAPDTEDFMAQEPANEHHKALTPEQLRSML